MLKDFEQHFSSVLNLLDKSHDEMIQSHGYNEETELLKILCELIKEQMQNENTHPPTCKAW